MKVTCPECGKTWKAPEGSAGRTATCSACKTVFIMDPKPVTPIDELSAAVGGVARRRTAAHRSVFDVPDVQTRVTIQQTGKRLKVHLMLAVIAAIVGMAWAGGLWAAGVRSPWLALLLCPGWVWLLITRIRIWWHHG